MKPPRISILAIMAAVIVVAVDCMLVRAITRRPEGLDGRVLPFVIEGSLPMANLLAIGLALWLRETGRRRPFLLGFLTCGAVALGAYVGLVSLRLKWVFGGTEWGVGPLVWKLGLNTSPHWATAAQFVIIPAFLAMPQLLFALIGGASSYLVLRRHRPRTGVEPVIRRHRFRPLFAPLVLVIVPALAIEGYLRWKVDPVSARLGSGSVAVIDRDDLSTFRLYFRNSGGSDASLTSGTRLRIDGDDAPDELGIASLADMRLANVRRVRITLLDGPRAGESTWMIRCLLRPAS